MATTGLGVEMGAGVGHRAADAHLNTPFHSDRLADKWYAGQPIDVGESVAQVIDRFSPRSVPADQWGRVKGLVRDSVKKAAPVTAHSAEAMSTVVTQLVVWVDAIGQPLEPEVVFHPDTIDRFALEGRTGLAPGTRHNYRTQLRTVGAAVLGPEFYPPAPLALPRPKSLAPYSTGEVASLRSWARGLPTQRYRENMGVILGLGLGAGLHSQEINRLVGTDITVTDNGVTVRVIGERDRVVPVLREYENEVEGLARRAGAGPVFLPGRTGIDRKQVPNFIARCPGGSLGRPNANRLRNTWIVRHLSAGTHLSVLAEAAGVRADQLVRYQAFATAPSSEVGRQQLRDPG